MLRLRGPRDTEGDIDYRHRTGRVGRVVVLGGGHRRTVILGRFDDRAVDHCGCGHGAGLGSRRDLPDTGRADRCSRGCWPVVRERCRHRGQPAATAADRQGHPNAGLACTADDSLGALALFDATGILVGPIIGALYMTVWKLWGSVIEASNEGGDAALATIDREE